MKMYYFLIKFISDPGWKFLWVPERVCMLVVVVFLRFYLFISREGKGGRNRGGETLVCSCLSHAPYWGPGPQPRHVPWLRIQSATHCFAVWRSIHWATPARVTFTLNSMLVCVWILSWVKPRTHSGSRTLRHQDALNPRTPWIPRTPWVPGPPECLHRCSRWEKTLRVSLLHSRWKSKSPAGWCLSQILKHIDVLFVQALVHLSKLFTGHFHFLL